MPDAPKAPRLPLVPAAYVLLLRHEFGRDQILLQLRQNTGYRDGWWAAAAAGHVDAGESVVACAVRETREELGVEVDPDDLRPLTSVHRTDGSLTPVEQRIDMFFTVHRWEGEPQPMEPHKCAAIAWFPLDDLPEQVSPPERMVYDRLAASDVPPVLTYGFN